MESSEEEPRPRGIRPSLVGWIVVGVTVAVIAVWTTVTAATTRDPEETVEAYLTAITEKDVDGALALVSRYGHGVPYGDTAAFLTPDAIDDDWWVVSVAEVGRDYGTARVDAVIAGPGGTATGEFEVAEYDDEWLLSDPFVLVEFPASPLSYVQVNDTVVPTATSLSSRGNYWLFPGTYRFYQSVPDVVSTRKTAAVAAFPPPESAGRRETVVVPMALTAGRRTVDKAQKAVRATIDACARFATEAPYGNCPFATDGEIDTPAGKRVTDVHGLKWTVQRYPVVTMTDDRSDEYAPGFLLRVTEPGTVTLSGSGVDSDGAPAAFTVTCDIDLTGVHATVAANGDVALTAPRQDTTRFDTCRRDA